MTANPGGFASGFPEQKDLLQLLDSLMLKIFLSNSTYKTSARNLQKLLGFH